MRPGAGDDAGSAATGREPATQRGDRWTSLAAPKVAAIGLLPLRIFLGVTYLYAGIDKLISPHFFVEGDPFSVAGQLAGYAQTSPLAPLINAAMPAAIQIGFLVALAELAIGIGVLTGLSYRLSAAAGAALSLLFWLTASWSSTPYFFSPDLPYAFGFLTLTLVGHGGLMVVGLARDRATHGGTAQGGREGPVGPASPGRRSILQLGVLAALTMVTAGVAASLRLLGGTPGGGSAAGGGATEPPFSATPAASLATPGATAAPSAAAPTDAPTASPATPAPSAPPSPPAVAGPVIASLTDFDTRNGLPFQVPFEAVGNLNPGGPAILVKLGDGTVVAYSAVCTHGRCTVGWDAATSIIQCPCHTARFDPANKATVLSGPAPAPLPSIPIAVDEGGKIHMTAVR